MSETENLRALLAEHRIYGFNGTEVACRCDRRKWHTLPEWEAHVASAILTAAHPDTADDRADLDAVTDRPTRGLMDWVDLDAVSAICSQCGERSSAMVKIGTTDGWCTICLDEAAEPTTDLDAVRREAGERIAQAIEGTPTPYWLNSTLNNAWQQGITDAASVARADAVAQPDGSGS
jgi:hypothetical protein